MFKNYLKTAWNNLSKNKTFGLINVFGLTIGTLGCLYILLFVSDQYHYDLHQKDGERIFRINRRIVSVAQSLDYKSATTAAASASLMKKDFPEVETFTRVVPFLGVEKQLLRIKEKTIYEKDGVYVDSNFFEVFNYHFLAGNPATALKNPYDIVLLKPTADKLFGKEDPLGKVITIDNVYGKHDYTVKGIVDESLGKSHLRANIFITMNSGSTGEYMLHTDSWITNAYVSAYVKLVPLANRLALEKKFPAFVEKYAGKQFRDVGIQGELFLQPLATIHTTTGLNGYQLTKPVSKTFLGILSSIAILIQLIACINFMNLSTANASKRAKEVGVRKAIGAIRTDLIKQFLSESFLLALTSVLLALPLLIIAMPWLNQLTGADIQLNFFTDWRIWALLFALITGTGIIAGSYPAFYLSAFNVIKVIKGDMSSQFSVRGMRRSLVVFQFVLSIVLITGILIVYSQLNYIKKMDLGFAQDQRIIFSLYAGDGFDKIGGFMDKVRQLPEAKEVSNASKYLGNPSLFNNGFFLKGQKDADSRNADFIISDEYFVRANGVKLVSGRDFVPTDSAKVLVNETFAKSLGLTPQTAVGTHIYDNQSRVEEIIGVMKDFNYMPLYGNVGGFLVWINNAKDGLWPHVIVHSNTADYKKLLSKIEAIWQKEIPGVPFDYVFANEEVGKQYEADISMSKIISSFTLVAIGISCLGLFGLAAFSAEQRRKEIGIRKLLGASIPHLTRLLSMEFLKLVLVAFGIAIPIGWWVMNKWLDEFAYRINISWWMFALSGFIAICIALFTVSFQSIRTAMANPARSLKTE